MILRRYRALVPLYVPEGQLVSLTYRQADRRRAFVDLAEGQEPWPEAEDPENGTEHRAALMADEEARRVYSITSDRGAAFKAGELVVTTYKPANRREAANFEALESSPELEGGAGRSTEASDPAEGLPGVVSTPEPEPLSLIDRIRAALPGLSKGPNGRPKLADVSNALGTQVSRADLTKALRK